MSDMMRVAEEARLFRLMDKKTYQALANGMITIDEALVITSHRVYAEKIADERASILASDLGLDSKRDIATIRTSLFLCVLAGLTPDKEVAR